MGRDQGGVRRRIKHGKDLLPNEEPHDPDWPYAKGHMDWSAKLVGFAVVVISLSLVAYFRYQQHLRDIIITPLDAPTIIASNASTPAVNPDRFWGTYRQVWSAGSWCKGGNYCQVIQTQSRNPHY
ncbi:hypothetical protein V1264_013223 [Littorina saxatilis]|uniref:Uncharacterized protein n=1 Tax=Littorina saxatilis TaxID=31220 RepID=A0AAN9BSZ2_9CAEN